MSGSTATRREISLNWRSRTKATGASITVPASVDEVDIPLIDLLKDNEQPGWFLTTLIIRARDIFSNGRDLLL